MRYVGEWEQEDFIEAAGNENEIECFKGLLDHDTLSKTDDIRILWEDLGYDAVAYVFRCAACGKKRVVCQSY